MDGELMLQENRVQHQDKATDSDKVLREARDRMGLCIDGWSDNRSLALDDIKFRNGEQWPEHIKTQREQQNRPCLTFNQMESFIDQVVGDQRQNRPGIKVRPADQGMGAGPIKLANVAGSQDYDVADVYTGIIRNIEALSRADIAYDTAFDHATGHGFGYIRVATEYTDDDSFDQDIRIKRVRNPFTVYLDPAHQEPDGSDALYGFVGFWIDKDEYQRRYPNSSLAGLEEGLGERFENWFDGERIRVSEYFRKVPAKLRLALLENGETVRLGFNDKEHKAAKQALVQQGRQIIRERMVKSHRVEWFLLSGAEILEGPRQWPGKWIPIVPVYGKELDVEGKVIYRGVFRHSKDAQRAYNFWRTSAAELVALAPKAPYVGPAKAFKGFEAIWRTANTQNHAYLPFNDEAPVAPRREPPGQIPTGAVEEAQAARQDMMHTTGIYQASRGEASNETSGRAIMARQREGDTNTFAFIDNLSRSIQHVGRILVDLIPKIYDTERVMRIRMPDDTEDFVPINITTPDGQKLHDLGVGKYDVVVKTGPSYTTQRQEAAEAIVQFIQALGGGDPITAKALIMHAVKNMDWPGADEIVELLKKTLPSDLIEQDPDAPQPEPPPPTPEQQAGMADAQAKMAKAEADMAKAQADTIKAQATIAKAEADMAKVEETLANLDENIKERVAEAFAQAMTEMQ